jgi:hypothetical protein
LLTIVLSFSAILYSLNRDKKFQGPNLFAYYILAFLFAGK